LAAVRGDVGARGPANCGKVGPRPAVVVVDAVAVRAEAVPRFAARKLVN
jgi:hypothetical protein